jgi:hypothetical protein
LVSFNSGYSTPEAAAAQLEGLRPGSLERLELGLAISCQQEWTADVLARVGRAAARVLADCPTTSMRLAVYARRLGDTEYSVDDTAWVPNLDDTAAAALLGPLAQHLQVNMREKLMHWP